jgi:nitronate monooxygenase
MKNELTNLLKLKYPIVQGPFGGGLSSIELCSTVSNLGGLGSYGAQGIKADDLSNLIEQIRLKTNAPFNMNLWVSSADKNLHEIDENIFQNYLKQIAPLFDRLNVEMPSLKDFSFVNIEDQIEGILKSAPPVVSFVYGVPAKEMIRELKKRNIKLIGTALTLEEAEFIQDSGLDAVVLSGFEAGGHRVSFLRPVEESLYGSFSLAQLCREKIHIPKILAGGIVDCHGVSAALSLGMQGVQVGTAFLACDESNASRIHKKYLHEKKELKTVLTKHFTGRMARGLENKLVTELNELDLKPLPYPLQLFTLSKFKNHCIENDIPDYFSMWAGQIFPLVKYHKAHEVFLELCKGLTSKS